MAGIGCEAPRAGGDLDATPRVIESTQRYRKKYVLAPGDELDVVVRQTPEVSRSCVVRPDGYISLPLLDDVEAAGLTIEDLDHSITERLGKTLTDPDVTVVATNVRPAEIFVAGEVRAPAAIALRDAPTAAQAIIRAGGFKDSACPQCVAVIRLVGDRLVAQVVEVGIAGQPGPYLTLQNVAMQSDDIVFVPKSGVAQFRRWIDDYVNAPVATLSPILQTYFQYRLIFELAN